MSTRAFFPEPTPRPLRQIAETVGGSLADGVPDLLIARVAPLEVARRNEISFIRSGRFLPTLEASEAGAVFCPERLAERVAKTTIAVVVADPHAAFAAAASLFFPDALRPRPLTGETAVSAAASVDPSARLEPNVVVEAGAVVGPGAEVGEATVVGPHAVIGAGVRIGRSCLIGAGATVQHALIGDRVLIHPGARIGQDGFGFVMGRGGHRKVPQVGRVIIQDDVEIGANSTVDRGSAKDTVIGQGTKIDNLVQIAHNVSIGCHCVIAANVGISGSSVLEDFVVLAGGVGVSDNIRIGMGAQIAGSSAVADDVPAGGRWVGTPARPVRRWIKELMALSALANDGVRSARERVRRDSRR